MADKKSAREQMAEREAALDKFNTIGLGMRRYPKSAASVLRRMVGKDDYGTSLGGGAKAAEVAATNKAWDAGKSLFEMEPEVRQAMREAAAEERREAKEPRKYAKGGVTRGDGCVTKGHTKGKMR